VNVNTGYYKPTSLYETTTSNEEFMHHAAGIVSS